MDHPYDPDDPYGRPEPAAEVPRPGPGLALGGLVCSVVGSVLCLFVVVAGIVMGHTAYGRAKRGEATGRGLAVAAFVVGYAGLVVNAGLVALIIANGWVPTR
ncbi:DUF4190 domain-containing protein [Amycolatopsis stemonae]